MTAKISDRKKVWRKIWKSAIFTWPCFYLRLPFHEIFIRQNILSLNFRVFLLTCGNSLHEESIYKMKQLLQLKARNFDISQPWVSFGFTTLVFKRLSYNLISKKIKVKRVLAQVTFCPWWVITDINAKIIPYSPSKSVYVMPVGYVMGYYTCVSLNTFSKLIDLLSL